MKKGIIFDLDGTLWDSCAVVADSWNEYLRLYAPDLSIEITEEKMRGVMGLTMTDLGNKLLEGTDPERIPQLTAECCVYEVKYLENHGGVLYPHVVEVLRELSKEYHLYIVSNCQVGYIEDFINWSKTGDLIEDIENFGRTGREKSYNIRLLAERNHLDAAVYVGDTQGDYNSTCEAGLPFILAGYGFGSVDAEVETISCFTELKSAVKKLIG